MDSARPLPAAHRSVAFCRRDNLRDDQLLLDTEPRQLRQLNPKIDRDLAQYASSASRKIQSADTLRLSRWPRILNTG